MSGTLYILYTVQDTLINEVCDYQYQTTKIVMSLCEKVLDDGRCLYSDNWYSSMELLDELRKRSTDVVGTIRKDRKGLPMMTMNAKLKAGEKAVEYAPAYNVVCMQ